jgi:hypothetical protein
MSPPRPPRTYGILLRRALESNQIPLQVHIA